MFFSWRNWLFSWIESTCYSCMCLFTVWCRGVKVQPQLLIYIQCLFLLVGHILVYAKQKSKIDLWNVGPPNDS